MAYERPIRDMPRGALWEDHDGALVRILDAGERHVSFRRIGGPAECLHEMRFRERYRPYYNAPALRSQFQVSLANLERFNVFWVPRLRRILARSIGCTREFAVPDGALHVGIYSQPCSAKAFFSDLDDVIRKQLRTTATGA
jgi:hypothetical protein